MISLKTGTLVVKVIRIVERINTKEPKYIQNSLDQKGSSSSLTGKCFRLRKYAQNPKPMKNIIKARSWPSIPLEVNACAEEIGRASCRERVMIEVGGVAMKREAE